jgi:protein-disulfide isomerase
VAWVEFSDFQCPFCSKIYNDAEAQVKVNYIEKGKVKFYFRDYPLPFHPNAMPGANAARCADAQGKFWEMHDQLFTNQATWSGLSDAGDVFKGYAADIGLDNASFASCYDQSKYKDKITADSAQGSTYGVSGTPSNFLVIQKGKISEADVKAVVTSLNQQYGQGIELFINDDSYVVLIPGAYPYATFDAVLSKVNY